MVQIAKYVAGEQLDTDRGGMPRPQLSDAMARGVGALGGAVQNMAQVAIEKKKQKDTFATDTGYRKLNLQLGRQLAERAQNNMPEDGEGFHDDYIKNVYNPERDKFLSGIKSPELREKYELLLGDDGPDRENWSIRSAETENTATKSWAVATLGEGQNELAIAISQDPAGYDRLLKQGYDEIDSAPRLSAAERREQKAAWEGMAQLAHLNRRLEIDPEGIVKDLGGDPRYLSPTTQYDMLERAVIGQESGGDSNAVSVKGAVGLMQVMPGTAIDIAKEIGDPNFNPKWNAIQITEYLSNPVTNRKYGSYYLKKQIRDFAKIGGLEAALIAYNGGPERAKAWIASGFDDSVIPKESADYYKKIMSNLPGMAGTGKGDPKSVQIEFKSASDTEGLSTDLQDRVKTSFASLGLTKVKVNSGTRTKEKNSEVGGAQGSQHIHGNAMDIDVSGYSTAERVQLIQSLSANGITGLGIGSNIIHADLGGRRAWGYATSAGGGSVPAWAKGAIDAHLANASKSPVRGSGGINGRYASMSYNDRQSYIQKADSVITQRYNVNSRENAVQRVEMRESMQNELSSITATGVGTNFDDTQVATVLGEDDYVKWTRDKNTAQRMFTSRDGISGMTMAEMADRVDDYKADPGSPTFADDMKVQTAVEREVDRVTKLRASNPAAASMEFPDVQQAYAKVQESIEQGEADPAATQEFVKRMLDRQKDFNLKPGSEAPVPRTWAMSVGQSLARVPELAGKNRNDVNAAIVVQYQALQKVFGEYTEEVILYALSEYRGVGPNTATLLTGYMTAIEAGGDPLKLDPDRAQDRAQDRDAIEATSNDSWFSSIKKTANDFWNGAPSEEAEDEDVDLRPFNPGEQRDNGDGTISTELSTTWELDDGSWVNVPSLWMGKGGKPVQFDAGDEAGILGAMRAYEQQTGRQLPRFASEGDAVKAAEARSKNGGAAEEAQPSSETIRRVIGQLNGATPEEEADIAARYGQRAYEAAKRSIAGGRGGGGDE